MPGYVYVLFSQKDKRTYLGSTDNLERRYSEHCKGKVKSTKNRLPLIVIYKQEFPSLLEARKMEQYYKTCSGRKRLKIILYKVV